jgi:membrane-bound lytic murein transglycosylase A
MKPITVTTTDFFTDLSFMNLYPKERPFQEKKSFLSINSIPIVQFFKLFLPRPYSTSKLKAALTASIFVLLGLSFHNFTFEAPVYEECIGTPSEFHGEIDRKGKLIGLERLSDIYTPESWLDLGFPKFDEKLHNALQNQLKFLETDRARSTQKAGSLSLTEGQMKETIEVLLKYGQNEPENVFQYLEPHKVWGKDKKGNVYFTGYYSPTLKVRKTPDAIFKYPIYAFPKGLNGKIPSRQAIDEEDALKGKGLEIAYASNKVDVYFLQLQGSGMVEFQETGERIVLKYAGENGHRYRNIEHYFKKRRDLKIQNITPDGIRRFVNRNPHLTDSVLFYNPSYVFFKKDQGPIKGAAHVPLTEGISIAADSRFFPPGSVILAALPIIAGGKVTHHEYRILLPQDVGGAVRGAGHVDLYCGVGSNGRIKASELHHYGQIWMLLPKRLETIAMR